ncbi:5856_t:CDS:1, partial [Racocetra persica]
MLPLDKWQLIIDLVKVLQSFANTTKMLGGSEYATMSYMFLAISSLKKLLNITCDAQFNPDLDNSDTVFDNNQEFQEEIDLIDESEMLDIESETKINQTKINTH